MTSPKVKRCPRCGQVKSLSAFYRRRGGARTSPYCQSCTRVASREARNRRRRDPASAELLRAVDRSRQRRRRDGGQAVRYAQAALQREAARVRAAAPHTCNDTLNRAAFNLGQLVAAGLLEAEQVQAALLAGALAAPATGHGDRERKAKATIASGLRGGAVKPRRRRDGAP